MDKKSFLKEAIVAFNAMFKSELQACEHSHTTLSPYHMEGDVYTHTMMVVGHIVSGYYMNLTDDDAKIILLAGLLHDVGKPYSSMIIDEKKHMSGHEIISAQKAIDFLMETKYLHERDMEVCIKIILLHTSAHDTDPGEMGLDQRTVHLLTILNTADHLGRIYIRE